MVGKRIVSIFLVLCVCVGLMIFPATAAVADASAVATVTKLPGNTNLLTISVTDSNGSYEKDFYIANNTEGLYYVEGYSVFVSTYENTKVDQCYIAKSIYLSSVANNLPDEDMPIVPYGIFDSYPYEFDSLWSQTLTTESRGIVAIIRNESYTNTITAEFSTTETRYQEIDVSITAAIPYLEASLGITHGQSESFTAGISAPLPPRHQISFFMDDIYSKKRFSYIQHHYVLGIYTDSILYMGDGLNYSNVVLTAGNLMPL